MACSINEEIPFYVEKLKELVESGELTTDEMLGLCLQYLSNCSAKALYDDYKGYSDGS